MSTPHGPDPEPITTGGLDLSHVEAADLTGLDRATLFRIEGAKVKPQERSLRALLDAYSASEKDRAELAALLNVTIQVIPRSVGAYPGMHGAFVLLEFPDEGHDVVYMEGSASDLFLESDADIARYSMLFEHLRAVAAGPDATRALLAVAQRNWKEDGHDGS
ncbi:Scr1 family TA system antitoxin-like transcriptional regulator [Streptosporangium sp. NPDC006007]|uniref:Scr1 family TA system antitoxin-like transcriptional regulator n=1 Tax=Streptosporangium sp. NPDC006007 TaxID=3154575 RepID=UPI0033BD7BAA